MFKSVFIFLALCTSCIISIQGQKNNTGAIGYFVNQDLDIIDGYLDITYTPKTKQVCKFTLGDTYSPGHYYDLNGNKITGKIRYTISNNYFRFSTDEGKTSQKIKPDECLSYVVGKDSFTVIRNFTVERQLVSVKREEPNFVEVIQAIDSLTFYQHTTMNPMAQNPVTTYIVKEGKNGSFVSFPQNNLLFSEIAMKYFGHISYLKAKLAANEYYSANMLEMIKYLDFHNHFLSKKPILYSASWEEVSDSSKAIYYGRIERFQNNHWTINYYLKDGSYLYQGNYSSIFPMEKNGTFTFYDEKGAIRKKVAYTDGSKKDSITQYFPDGKTHYVYASGKKLKLKKLFDVNGNALLDKKGNGTETFYDSIANRLITRVYKSNKLNTAYYTTPGGQIVYQCYNRKPATLKREADSPMYGAYEGLGIDYPLESVTQNNHGLVLVRILIDSSGKTNNISLLKGVDTLCNSQILIHCQKKFTKEVWSPLIINNKPVNQELILSYIFEIKAFSRYRNNYYYNNNWMWQQQMMMNQQNAIQNMRPPTIGR